MLLALIHQFRPSWRLSRIGLVAFILSALFAGSALPVIAASPITITVDSVTPGGEVQLTFANLPAGQTFMVEMGAGGSLGVGPVVANFETGVGGTETDTFEILADVRTSSSIAVRIDNGAGLTAFTTFNNTTAFTAVSVNTPETTSTAAIPVTGATTAIVPVAALAPASGVVRLVHVEQGGWVQAEIDNLPANTTFTVSVGLAGSKGIGGYVVADLQSDPVNVVTAISTFEIPQPLTGETSLDLRLEAPGYVYVLTFSNTNR